MWLCAVTLRSLGLGTPSVCLYCFLVRVRCCQASKPFCCWRGGLLSLLLLFISRVIKSHGATARARRLARSPPRVHPRAAKAPQKTRVLAPRPRRSPQRVAGRQKSQKTSSLLYLDLADPCRRSPEQTEIAKNLEFLHLNHANPAEGRVGRSEIAKILKFLPRPRRSPQRVP